MSGFMAVIVMLMVGGVLLAIGGGLWLILHAFAAPYLARSFYQADRATIRDYYIYTPDISEPNVNTELPVLTLTLEGSPERGGYVLDTRPVDTATLMRTLKRAEQTAVFWYEKSQWDQLLLGTDIAVGISPLGKTVVLHEDVRRARRGLAQFCLALAIPAIMVLVSLKLQGWL